TGHTHVFPDAAWRGAVADGPIAAVHHRAVRHGLTMHPVLLDDTLKALALRLPDHIHQIARGELIDVEIDRAFERGAVRKTEFLDELLRLGAGFLKVAEQRLSH